MEHATLALNVKTRGVLLVVVVQQGNYSKIWSIFHFLLAYVSSLDLVFVVCSLAKPLEPYLKTAHIFKTQDFQLLTQHYQQFLGLSTNVQMVWISEKNCPAMHSIISNWFLCSILDICSLRFDFETFTTAAPTCTNDNCNCVDSFQITAVSNKTHQNSFCTILNWYWIHRVQVDLQHP